jgi:hypothetical protein
VHPSVRPEMLPFRSLFPFTFSTCLHYLFPLPCRLSVSDSPASRFRRAAGLFVVSPMVVLDTPGQVWLPVSLLAAGPTIALFSVLVPSSYVLVFRVLSAFAV